MPVRKEILEKNKIYHIYNSSNNDLIIFRAISDFDRFIDLINKYLTEYKGIKIISYSILFNHFHIILKTNGNPKHISLFMGKIQQAYSMYFKIKYKNNIPGLIGIPLFKGRFKIKEILDKELKGIQAYVNFNALKHGYVKNIVEYPYCSYLQTIGKEGIYKSVKISDFDKNIDEFYDETMNEFD